MEQASGAPCVMSRMQSTALGTLMIDIIPDMRFLEQHPVPKILGQLQCVSMLYHGVLVVVTIKR